MNNATAVNSEQQLLKYAVHAHQQGNLQHAEAAYRQVLAINPEQPDALQLLGVLASQVGNDAAAEQLITQSLAINPDNIDARFNLMKIYKDQKLFAKAGQLLEATPNGERNLEICVNLGELYKAQGKYEQAIKHFKNALNLQENNFEVLHDLAHLLDRQQRVGEAWDYYQKAYQYALSAPPSTETYTVMGLVCGMKGDFVAAIEHHKKALALSPNDPHLLNNLADTYKKADQLAEAEKLYSQAIAINPDLWEIRFNLGSLYREQGLLDDALVEYLKALALYPDSVQILAYVGAMYTEQSHFSKAREYLDRALMLDPENPQAHLALGQVESKQGRIKEAMQHYKHSFMAHNDYMMAYSNYLFIMHYDSTVTSEDIHKESLVWAARYTADIPQLEHANDPDPMRKLRIGYVSADLRHHPVTAYLEPVLKSHDKSQVEIFCYANQPISDEATERCQAYTDHWRNIYRLTNDAAARLVQEDKIDILIDLSGHTAGHRLLLFARKPAPIQATWIGYFNTTGMKAMDYIITDRFLLPPEEEHLYTEKPLRLPTSGAIYLPHDLPIIVNDLPALTNGYVTFGCFNAISKLTPEVIALWVEILKRVPTAKLFLKNKSFGNAQVCEQYRAQFVALGVDGERLIFSGQSPLGEYLQSYHKIDLGLDPFPYNGATTTFDSLWMGVPIIALKGDRLVAHIGESLLGGVGLEEFIAADKQAYVEKAVAFANDIPKLAEIRKNLRTSLTASPMTNPALFTRGLEKAFREVWKEWCIKRKAGSHE